MNFLILLLCLHLIRNKLFSFSSCSEREEKERIAREEKERKEQEEKERKAKLDEIERKKREKEQEIERREEEAKKEREREEQKRRDGKLKYLSNFSITISSYKIFYSD